MRFVAAVVGVLALGTASCTGGAQPAGDGLATVTDVIDGDTIDVEIGGRTERVRLIGIDTPETKKPNSPIECYGPEASAFTASLLPVGTEVRIERDVVGRDDYGRLLGYVHLVDADGSPTHLRQPRDRRAGLRRPAHDRTQRHLRQRLRNSGPPRRARRPRPVGSVFVVSRATLR